MLFKKRRIFNLLIKLSGLKAELEEYHKAKQIWPSSAKLIGECEEELRLLGYKFEIEE
jgi:hypothetical protein